MSSSGENLHLPKNLGGKILGPSNRSYDSCKFTQGSNFEFDLIFSNAFLLT